MTTYRISFDTAYQSDTVDLEDWGFDREAEWDDLTEEEQDDIKDGLREQNFVTVDIEEQL